MGVPTAVSPEAVVRDFLASWEHPSAEQLAAFFTTDAVYIDGSGHERSGPRPFGPSSSDSWCSEVTAFRSR
jgi:hypothetical protein